MNGRKAKALRRKARDLTVGQPAHLFTEGSPPEFMQIPIDAQNPMGPQQVIKTKKGIPFRLAKNCTRKVYQELKKCRAS